MNASEEGEVGLYLLLASNPEEAAAGRTIIFGSPRRVDTFPFAKKHFIKLLAFVNGITKQLITGPVGEQKTIADTVLRDPTIDLEVAHLGMRGPTEEDLRKEMQELLGKLNS